MFGLVASRHEAFRPAEVGRVLAPGGTFITDQVDFHSYDGLCTLAGLDVPQDRTAGFRSRASRCKTRGWRWQRHFLLVATKP